MQSQELIDYVKKAKDSGMNDEQIRQILLNTGWKPEDIDAVLNIKQTNQPVGETLWMPSGATLLMNSFKIYFKHWKEFLSIQAVYLTIVICGLVFAIFGNEVIYLLYIPLGFLSFFTSFALLYFIFKSNFSSSAGDSFKKGMRLIIPIAWVSILTSLASLGGFILLIIPSILVGLSLSLSIYVFMSEDRKGMAALVKSWYYAHGNRGKLLAKYLFIFLFFILIAIAMSLIFGDLDFSNIKSNISSKQKINPLEQSINLLYNFLIMPVIYLYTYQIFEYFRKLKPQEPTEEETKKIKRKIVTYMIIGAIAIGMMLIFAGQLLFKAFSSLQQTSFLTNDVFTSLTGLISKLIFKN